MKDIALTQLAEEFEHRLGASIRECVELGYHPHRFEEMLRTSDGVTVAKHLIASGDLQDGLRRLKKMKRLDLSMEQIMLDPKFEPLFAIEQREAAEWRLKQVVA